MSEIKNPSLEVGKDSPIVAPAPYSLKKYIWSAWDIATVKGVDVGIGLAMFMGNVRTGKAEVEGADDVDYAALHNEYYALTEAERTAAYKNMSETQHALYTDLVSLRAEGKREAFIQLCESHVDRYFPSDFEPNGETTTEG